MKRLQKKERVRQETSAKKAKNKMENDYLIYAYIELDYPHRCYVGQTLQSRASQRDQDHRKGKSGSPYFNAFVLHEIIYGKKNFDDVLRYKVLENFRGTAKQCAGKEDEHIQRKNSIENGWNLLKSGVKNKHTEMQKENNRKNNPVKASSQGTGRVKTKGVLTDTFVQCAVNYGLNNGIIEKDKEYNLQELIVLIATAHLANVHSALNINEKPSIDEVKSVANDLNASDSVDSSMKSLLIETPFSRTISEQGSIEDMETAIETEQDWHACMEWFESDVNSSSKHLVFQDTWIKKKRMFIEAEQDWHAIMEWFESDVNCPSKHLAFRDTWIAYSDQKKKTILANIKSACLKKYQAKKKEIEERKRAREEEEKNGKKKENQDDFGCGCFVSIFIIVLIIIVSASGC